MQYKGYVLSFCLLFLVVQSHAAVFPLNTHYQVCFTPHQQCAAKLVHLIDSAKSTIYMQAYSFTSRPVIHALVGAAKRGVRVRIIFDKSQLKPQQYSWVGYLLKRGILAWEDYQLNIAHNKVIIVDRQVVETGSFNFTTSAEYYNAENLLIIDDKILAKQYLENWHQRQKVSKFINYKDFKSRGTKGVKKRRSRTNIWKTI